MTTRSVDHRPPVETALILHPARPGASGSREPESRLAEAQGLAEALDLKVTAAETAPLRTQNPATLFGKGKVAEIGRRCAELTVDVAVVDDALTPIQQRNLERAWQVKVIDRTGLILEIFARRARTREGRLQVELARLAYERSRLVKTWTHLERQRGGLGAMSGPGETQIETDRRLLAQRIARLKNELEEVRRTRGLARAARERVPFPTIALVGYTNAGKSTLFNRLTGAEVEARDALFATLDPTVRALRLPDGRPAMLSDTVGFISDLPHELVEAFRATLEAVKEADLVLHVRDIASPDTEAEAEDVRRVLAGLGAGADVGQPTVEVWNKIDLLDSEDRGATLARAKRRHEGAPTAFPVSAVTGEGADALVRALAEQIDVGAPVEAHVPAGDGRALAWLYRHGRILRRAEDGEGGLRLAVRLDSKALGRFERLFPEALIGLAAE
ncbi:MAG TPA: GTPase HflX [Caulobacteraceae bacterium]|nr:GTPase HflX [Caulobacteraceae bacterium]